MSEARISDSKSKRLRLLAVCGILSPIIAWSAAPWAMQFAGQIGEVIAGVLAGAFAVGLVYEGDTPSYRLGGAFVFIAAIGLVSGGLFASASGLNDAASILFAQATIVATLLIGATLIDKSQWAGGGVSIALGIIALAAGFSPLSQSFGGIGGTVRNAALSLWLIAFAIRMFMRAPHHLETSDTAP